MKEQIELHKNIEGHKNTSSYCVQNFGTLTLSFTNRI